MSRKPVKRPRAPKPPLMQRLRGDFLTGLVIVLPIFLTIYVVWGLVALVDSRVIPLIPARYNPENIFGRNIFGLGLLVFVVFTTLIGALTKGYVGARVVRYGESLVERMPIIRSIYNALKQVATTVFSQSSTNFEQACVVEFPRKDVWSIGFVVNGPKGELLEKTGEPDLVCVFIATTPNPTNGYLIYVPARDVVMLDMSLEDAAKLIMSAGLVGPAETKAPPVKTPAVAPRPASARA
ncbi:MAG: DUF502 domain-containing protein [Rhodobacteraceae bacterium]|nr:DUF502 domain-containing protein [Paracoccaceae bacterium]